MNEAEFIAALRALATSPAARGLLDDAAVLTPPPGRDLVLTHDMIAEGVHYLASDPAADVAWKLVAVNLSDLAAKGADPVGVLLGYPLGVPEWNAAFLEGLREALAHFAVPLLGGDTITAAGPRTLGLTAIGSVPAGGAPSRTGAQAGDDLWVCGTIGDAGLGLRIARGEIAGAPSLLAAYRRPVPLLAEGRALAPLAHATADVSDGLLIDATRIAAASGLAIAIDLATIPRSSEASALSGDDTAARLAAATAGDDYALLAAAAPEAAEAIAAIPGCVRVGRFAVGAGLSLSDDGTPVPVPSRLGYLHGSACQ
ncbi:MAG: thiamine-phosphate kinase [Sphingomonadaceae bacterium]|nr:thiamine-phosphate kinase [Sphingomonadaceae bacterium]